MKQALTFTGDLIYVALRIILLPLFVAVDCFIGLCMFISFLRRWSFTAFVAKAKQRLPLELPFRRGELRSRLVHAPIKSH
jgi:hypothetical protein